MNSDVIDDNFGGKKNNLTVNGARVVFISAMVCSLLAVTFQFNHWPFTGILMILSIALWVVSGITNALKQKKAQNQTRLIAYISVSAWMIYIIFRLMYWEFSNLFLYFGLINSGMAIMLSMKLKVKLKGIVLASLLITIFGVYLSTRRAYQVYYTMNLTESFHQFERANSNVAWDKYSWFLYLADKNAEALEANSKAAQITESRGENEILWRLSQNRGSIENRTWKKYVFLYHE